MCVFQLPASYYHTHNSTTQGLRKLEAVKIPSFLVIKSTLHSKKMVEGCGVLF